MSNNQKLKKRLENRFKTLGFVWHAITQIPYVQQRKLDLGCYKIYGGCKGGGMSYEYN